jgi:hypothetical protein
MKKGIRERERWWCVWLFSWWTIRQQETFQTSLFYLLKNNFVLLIWECRIITGQKKVWGLKHNNKVASSDCETMYVSYLYNRSNRRRNDRSLRDWHQFYFYLLQFFSSILSLQCGIPSQRSVSSIHLCSCSHFTYPFKHLYSAEINQVYSQIYIKRSPLGQGKCGLIRQVTSYKRFISYFL